MESAFPVFEPASPQADAIYHLFVQVLAISGVIFAIVAGLIVVAIYRFRARADEIPEQDFGSERKEMFWMVGPVIILLWLGAITAKLVLTIDAVPKAHPAGTTDADLVITGHQWWWEIHYVDAGLTGANEVHIPTGTKIRVQLASADVIHCFWVPQLARKMDVIPGRENYIWLEAREAGVYQGRCAEYCGTQHAWMNFLVVAHSPEDYAAWIKGERIEPVAPTEPLAVAGKKLFMTATCVACHAIEGTEAVASIGPDLTNLASRTQIGGGVIANSPENLALWLENPQALKPGCKMPNFKLNQQQIKQLVAYLEQLK